MRSRHGLSDKHATSACHFEGDGGGDYFLTVEFYLGNVTENIKGAFSCRETQDFAGVAPPFYPTGQQRSWQARGPLRPPATSAATPLKHDFRRGWRGTAGEFGAASPGFGQGFREVHDLNRTGPADQGQARCAARFEKGPGQRSGSRPAVRSPVGRMGICNYDFYAKHHYHGRGD